MKKLSGILFPAFLIFIAVFSAGCSQAAVEAAIPGNSFNNPDLRLSDGVHTVEGSRPLAVTKENRTLFLSIAEDIENYIWISKPGQTECERILYKSQEKFISEAAISDNWIVFSESSNNMTKADWTIRAYRIDDGSIYTIDRGHPTLTDASFDTPTLIGPLITAYGDRAIWTGFEYDAQGKPVAVVKMCELQKQTIEVIDQKPVTEGEFGQPSLYKNWLAYDSGKMSLETQSRNASIVLVNIQEKDKHIVVDSGRNLVNPVIFDEYFAWKSHDSIINICKINNINARETLTFDPSGVWNLSASGIYLTWNVNNDQASVYSVKDKAMVTVKDRDVSNGGNLSGNIFWWYLKKAGSITVEWVVLA